MSNVRVEIDNRIRLVAAVLAAGDWPDYEQVQKPHAAHHQARLTRQYAADFAGLEAAATANDLVARQGNLADLFTVAVRCSWPTFEATEALPEGYEAFAGQLADFYVESAIAAFFWSEHEAEWQEAQRDLKAAFNTNLLAEFLGRVKGRPLAQDVVIVPNLVYPALQSVAAANQNSIYLIMPPPQAYGESPPWPYRDGVDWVLAEACRCLCMVVLADVLAELDEPQQVLLKRAAATHFLDQAIGEPAAMSYLVRVKKEYNLPRLPTVVENMRDYLTKPGGRSLVDLL